MKVQQQLSEYESMVHESVLRVGRVVRNMRQEMGGYSSTTPGNGSPGGGKGGRPTASIVDPNDDLALDGVEVPVSSVETQVLFGRDDAAHDLARLHVNASRLANGLDDLLSGVGRDPGPDFADRSKVGADRVLVLGYARLRRLLDPTIPRDLRAPDVRDYLESPVSTVFHLCQNWGYQLGTPSVPKNRRELLAVDLTERWCTSHLRIGARRERSRGELCDWCYRHGPLLDASWDAPPVEVVQLHVDNGKVYAHQIDPLIRAERDRQRGKAKASR